MRNGILTLTFIFVASLAFAQAPASPVAGAWEGAIAVGAVKLRLGVTISAQPDGQLTATMDSPDQGAYGMRLSDVSFADGVLKFALRQANGAFEGRLNAAGTEIAGTWTQGEIVVCDRGTNARVEKAENVAAGGAGGFVLANSAIDGEGLSADAYVLPGVHLGYANSQILRAWLDAGTGHTAAIGGTAMDLQAGNGDILAHFSSRGPNGPVPGVLKPDVAAPGVAILAASRNDIEFQSMSGTSMASPFTAGAAALLRALHPGWTPAEIQAGAGPLASGRTSMR